MEPRPDVSKYQGGVPCVARTTLPTAERAPRPSLLPPRAAPTPQVGYTLSFSGEQAGRAADARDGLIAAATRAMVEAGAMQTVAQVNLPLPEPESKKER
jgi:hypothetical protein